VKCTNVVRGSIIVDLQGTPEDIDDRVEHINDDGLEVEGFPMMKTLPLTSAKTSEGTGTIAGMSTSVFFVVIILVVVIIVLSGILVKIVFGVECVTSDGGGGKRSWCPFGGPTLSAEALNDRKDSINAKIELSKRDPEKSAGDFNNLPGLPGESDEEDKGGGDSEAQNDEEVLEAQIRDIKSQLGKEQFDSNRVTELKLELGGLKALLMFIRQDSAKLKKAAHQDPDKKQSSGWFCSSQFVLGRAPVE